MNREHEQNTDWVDVDTPRPLLRQPDTLKKVHFPKCTCFAGPVYDFQLKNFKNGTLHVYRFCRTCGAIAQSPVKRETVRWAKWRELLIKAGREVRSL